MRASIVGFRQDAAEDWIAELSCEHSQHMRHRPPWLQRPWVTTEAGRASKLGTELDCPLCDRIAMPPTAAQYKRTATFTDQTLPAALRANHRTKPGTWALIVVEEGALEYHTRGRVQQLSAGANGVVEPERAHHIVPLGPVRVHVEFWRKPGAGS